MRVPCAGLFWGWHSTDGGGKKKVFYNVQKSLEISTPVGRAVSPWLSEAGTWAPQGYNHVACVVVFLIAQGAMKKMAVEGVFSLLIKGQMIDRHTSVLLKSVIHSRVKMIDPDALMEERDFGGLMYVFRWTGEPKKIDRAQSLFKFLKENMLRYFIACKFEIKIELYEERRK